MMKLQCIFLCLILIIYDIDGIVHQFQTQSQKNRKQQIEVEAKSVTNADGDGKVAYSTHYYEIPVSCHHHYFCVFYFILKINTKQF